MSEQDHDWLYMANLTHKTQVEEFNFCLCEDLDEGQEAPYLDCPVAESLCDSCTLSLPIKEYLLDGVTYYWCQSCKDDEGVLA